MRTIIGLTFLALSGPILLAQKSPKESAQILIGIHEQISAAAQYRMEVVSSVASEGTVYNSLFTNYQGLSTPVQSPNITCKIYPGRLYSFSTGATSWTSADVQFNLPPGYMIYMAPLNVPMTTQTSFTTLANEGGQTWTENFYVVANDGSSQLSAGYAKAPRVSDLTWAIGTGTLTCGASAGALGWRSTSVTQSLLDSTSLIFASSAPIINATSSSYLTNGPVPNEVATYTDSSGYLRYIGTNQVQFYISRNSGTNTGYTIQAFGAGIPFSWANNNPNQAWTFQGTATDQYTISDPDAATDQAGWAGRVQITRVNTQSATATDVWILALVGNTTSLTQTTSNPPLRVVTYASTPVTGGRTETYTVADGNNHVATQTQRNYQNFPWGEELVSEVADPVSTNDPNGLALTTSYTYYNTMAGDGQYSKLQSVTNPDGSWILYNYSDDFYHWGELASISTPWQDAPATSAAATSSNCKIITYNYAPQVYDLYVNGSEPQTTSIYQTLNAGSQTSINGVMTAQNLITTSIWQLTTPGYNSAFYGNEPMRTDTIKSYSATGVEQTTVKTVFHNTSDPTYSGKLYSQINPDGTKTSASYWQGNMFSWLGSSSWNSTYITPQSTSINLVSNFLSGTSTQQDPSAILYSTDGTTNGNAIDPVWMTPFKSYRRQIVNDSFGHPWYDLNEVFTGTGFQIISWRITGISFDGLLQNDEDGSGTITKRTYIDGQVNYLTNADGTQTQYYFDPLMRIQQTEFKTAPAYSTYPALGAVETYFTYDAAGRMLTSMKEPSGGGTTLSTASTYNLAGLPTSQTDSSGLVTSYSYTNGARTVTTTFPNGSTKVTDRHLDGAAKSITGNALVNQFVASVVNGDGTITTTTNLGTSGSSRSSTVQSDWLSRTISQTQPAFGGGTFTKQSVYNTSGQLTKTTQTGMSATLYQYDGLGQLQYTGLDVNNNGVIDLGGSDRITETRTQAYEDSNSIWWNQTLTYVFNQTGNSTPVLKSEVRQKLMPFLTTVTSETDSYDYFRNLTVETLNINEVNPNENGYNTTIVTDTTTLPNSAVPKITVKYNGVLMSSQTPQDIVTTYQYDGLYREISEIDPRKGTSSTAYFTSGAGENGRISSQTDAGGNATSYIYDPTDGRLFSQTDPLGDIVYHGYDHVGREIKTWGTGTFPVEYAFDAYGARIAMRTFRSTSLNFSSSTWPLSDDGGDPQNPIPTSWTNGDTTSWAFDAATGLLTSKKDAAGQSVGYTYNPNATLAKRTWARGVTSTYSYDPNTAEQIGISYSDGSPGLTYTFDRLGHGSSVVQAYSGFTLTTGLQYNVPGKLTQETLDSTYFSGRQLVYQLDTSNTGTLGRTIGYEMGTSVSPSLDEGSSLAYDSDGRLNAVGLTGGPTFTYAFTSNSNLIGSVTDSPDNWTQARTWDAHRDLLNLVQTSVGSTLEGAFTYALDALGRRTSKLQTGSLFSRYPATGLVDAYTYDSKSEVTADQAYQSNNPASLTTKVLGRGFTFAYDPIGNRTTSAVDATQTTSYTENALNQITSRTVPGYYAASGFAPTGATVTLNGTAIPSGQFAGQYYLENVTATNSSAPLWLTAQASSSLGGSVTANAFVPQTPEASTYDADGNILTDGRWNYFWDAENRLKAIETFGNQAGNSKSIWNSGVPLIHIDFKYDYNGRRISKLISTWSGSAFVASSETRYAYENWNLMADYSVSGSSLSLAHSYLWGIDLSGKIHGAGGVGGLLAMISASGAIELPVYDGNGNVQALTDRSTAQMTAAYEYSPYGQPLRTIGTDASVNPFRFSTKYTDNETDLVYYGRRYYNPALGRFLGRDPKGEKGGLHLYAFVSNNAPNEYDVLGQYGTLSQSGNNITINVPIYFNGASSQQISEFLGSVKQYWNGTFGGLNVTTTVSILSSIPSNSSAYNVVNVNNSTANQPSTTSTVLGNPHFPSTITWFPNSPNNSNATPAHEIGHALGLIDQYTSTYQMINGQRVRTGTTPNPGYGNDIMGSSSGTVSLNDITKILSLFGKSGVAPTRPSIGSNEPGSPGPLASGNSGSNSDLGNFLNGVAGNTDGGPQIDSNQTLDGGPGPNIGNGSSPATGDAGTGPSALTPGSVFTQNGFTFVVNPDGSISMLLVLVHHNDGNSNSTGDGIGSDEPGDDFESDSGDGSGDPGDGGDGGGGGISVDRPELAN